MRFIRHLCLSALLLTLWACSGPAPRDLPETQISVEPTPAEPATAAAPADSIEIQAQPAIAEPEPEPAAQPLVAALSVAAAGDVMLGTTFPDNWLSKADGAEMLAATADYFRAADVAFLNLEGVLLDDGKPRKKCKNPQRCYLFRSPERYVNHLLDAGIDVVSLANNHARDFGESGRSNTMAVLDEAGIRHSGRDGDVASWEAAGLRVAMIAYAPFANAHDFLDIEAAVARVAELAAEHDIVIVSMHAGAEGLDVAHLTYVSETFVNENRGNAYKFAHAVIDAGADLVIGHGPHIPRAMELYRDRLIAYSLGNYATNFGISVAGKKGWAPLLQVNLDAEGRFVDGSILSAIQRRPDGVIPDPGHRAAREIANLTVADFPDSELQIDADGQLRRRGLPEI